MIKVFLGLGSNLGDSLTHLSQARALLSPHLQDFKASSIVLSEPMYVLDQPKFYNQVVMGSTDLSPHELLKLTQEIQDTIGRIKNYRFGPRSIDIDILYYGNFMVSDTDLIIPHPRIHERLFVLQPLVELDPQWVCPQTHKTVSELIKDYYQNQAIQKPLPIVESSNLSGE